MVECFYNLYLPGPLRPRVIPPTRNRGSRQQLEVDDGFGAMTHRSTDAVIASVSSSNDDNILSFSIDIATILKFRVQESLRVQLIQRQDP